MALVFLTDPKLASSLIRGEQIAKRLNVECNPPQVSINDTAVLVKAWTDEVKKLKKVYLDVVDSLWTLEFVQENPDVNIIAISDLAKQYISARIENDIVVIQEQHCNQENVVRNRDEVNTVGYIGSKVNLNLDIDDLKERLRSIGLDFNYLFIENTSVSREDVCDFYKQIDIQLTFRKPKIIKDMPPELKNPLKLSNAGSFKIPTVGYPELNYMCELPDCFVPAKTLDEVVRACRDLKNDSDLYKKYSEYSYVKAQDYHIDKIAELYRELEDR